MPGFELDSGHLVPFPFLRQAYAPVVKTIFPKFCREFPDFSDRISLSVIPILRRKKKKRLHGIWYPCILPLLYLGLSVLQNKYFNGEHHLPEAAIVLNNCNYIRKFRLLKKAKRLLGVFRFNIQMML